MKTKISTFIALFLLIAGMAFSQAPNSFKYQSMLRKTDGSALASQNITVRISILKGSLTGSSVYTETQTATTNSFGIVNLNIGGGTVTSGSFSAIDWSASSYFVKVETDETGGINYTLSSTSQLLSVPYALYAGKAGNLSDTSKYIEKEIDPIFNASVAKNIKTTDTTRWGKKSNFSGSYTDLTNKPSIPDTLKKLKLDAGNSIINNVANPINKGDAANKAYVDTSFTFAVSKIGDTLYLGKNRFVIIPNLSAKNNGIGIKTQVPNITWSKVKVSDSTNLLGNIYVAFGINTFVAVTDNGCGSTNNSAYVSNDFGNNWVQKATPGSTDMCGIAFSPVNNYFVVAHRCYESNRNYSYSTDSGKTWTALLHSPTTYRYDMYRVKNYFFSCIINNGCDKSSDGVNWTELTFNGAAKTYSVGTYSEKFGLYYANSYYGYNVGIPVSFWTSPDGTNWTQRDTLGNYHFVAGNDIVLAYLSTSTTCSLIKSIDGLTFSKLNTLPNITSIQKMKFKNGMFWASITVTGDNTKKLMVSFDGTDWQMLNTPALNGNSNDIEIGYDTIQKKNIIIIPCDYGKFLRGVYDSN